MRVAILGTGRMGGAMARTLAKHGVSLVVFNRTIARAQAVAEACGATFATTAAEAVSGADVVITMLADGAAVEAVLVGRDGAVGGLAAGTVVCEMSTVEPSVSQRLADAVRATGADILDAPVSGSVPTVERGALTIMVGGDARSLEQARPVLDALATRVFHMGPLGTGAAIKLAVNAIIHGLNEALSEALVLAEQAGIAREVAYEVFASSAAAAPFVGYKREAFEHPDETAVAFSLDLVEKDLDLILRLARSLGVPMEQVAVNHEVAAAAARTLGEKDMSALAAYHRSRLRSD